MSEQSVEPKENPVKKELPKNKFEDYDPELVRRLIKLLLIIHEKEKRRPNKSAFILSQQYFNGLFSPKIAY